MCVFAKLGLAKKDADGAEDKSTNPHKGLLVEDKAIQQASSNGIAISVMTLQQPHHIRVVNIICEVATPMSDFHTMQNRNLRSIIECKEHSVAMIVGGYMENSFRAAHF